MKSIIQPDKTRCFLCDMPAGGEHLDEHHVFAGGLRKKSEQYGLKVYLHHNTCHIFGAMAVHNNAQTNNAVKAAVQKIAMQHYGWTMAEWFSLFGKNYIMEDFEND